jgi:hypothetical protein
MATKTKQQALSTPVHVTSQDLKRLSRPKENFTRHVQPLLALYDAHLDELRALTSSEVNDQLAAYESLLAQEAAAQEALDRVQETRALRGSTVWSAMLDIYARAQAAGRNDADIQRGIEDFQAFLKHGKRAKKTTAPANPTPVPSAA